MHRAAVAGDLPARLAVGGRSEHVEVFGEAEAPGVVGRLAEEIELRTVRQEAEHPGVEFHRHPADRALEARVTEGCVDPAVEAVAQVRNPGMGVVGLESLEQHRPFVRHVVAIRVLEEKHPLSLAHDRPAIHTHHRSRQAQPVGEDRELVGLAVAVAIPANLHPVALRATVVRVVHRLDHPQPVLFIPSDRDRVHHVRFRREQRKFETRRYLRPLHRVFRRKRLLDLRHRLVGLVAVGQQRGHVLQLRQVADRDVALRRPANPAGQQFVETLLVPAAFVVAVRGIENPALALLADPGPRLVAVALQDGQVVGQPVVPIGLVPRFKGLVALHRRVLRLDHPRGENTLAVALDLAADQVDVTVGLLEAGRPAVHRHEAAAALDEALHRRQLFRRDFLMVGINQQHVILRQVRRRQRLHALLVGQVNPPVPARLLEHRVAVERLVIEVVTEEKHLDRPCFRHRFFPRREHQGAQQNDRRHQSQQLHGRFHTCSTGQIRRFSRR